MVVPQLDVGRGEHGRVGRRSLRLGHAGVNGVGRRPGRVGVQQPLQRGRVEAAQLCMVSQHRFQLLDLLRIDGRALHADQPGGCQPGQRRRQPLLRLGQGGGRDGVSLPQPGQEVLPVGLQDVLPPIVRLQAAEEGEE